MRGWLRDVDINLNVVETLSRESRKAECPHGCLSGGVASAFTLHRSGTGGTIGDVTLSTTATSPTNSVTLTFSGSLSEFGSLVDGLFDFTIDAAQVTGVGGALDGNNDSIPGGSY